MNVSIISFGKFHSFDLARELKNRGLNVSLYSSYPFFIAKKYNLTKFEFFSFFLLQLLDRLCLRFFSEEIKIIFSKIVFKILKKNQQYFIIWSDIPSSFVKRLKADKNSKIIIERGSAHINYQTKLLIDEYKINGLKFNYSKSDIQNEIENYNLGDYISIPSYFAKKTFLLEGINEKKIFLNPYGTDLTKFKKINNEKKGKFTFVSCGLASIQKGFLYLLQSHKYIEGDFCHIHIGRVDNEIKKKISDYPNLKILGSIKHDQLYKYYNLGHVFIFPSIQDGFGMVILEAMACGLPVIATKNTGITTIKSNNLEFGFKINIRDSKDIAIKINQLKNDNSLLNLYSENSLKIIKDGKFKWEDYGSRYSNFLNEKRHTNY